MNTTKIILSIVLVILVGGVLFFYNAFNGNPISKFVSKKVLDSYLSDNYPDRDFRMDDGFYDFKFSEYVFDVKEIGDTSAQDGNPKTYEFHVRGFLKPTVNWDGIYYSNLDESLMEKLNSQASKEMKDVIAEKVPSINAVDVLVEVLKGDHPSDTNWDKNLKLQKPMQLHIQLNSTNQTKEEFFNDTKVIQQILNENGYNYGYVSVNGNGFDNKFGNKDEGGYVKYYISFEKDTNLKLNNVKEENN